MPPAAIQALAMLTKESEPVRVCMVGEPPLSGPCTNRFKMAGVRLVAGPGAPTVQLGAEPTNTSIGFWLYGSAVWPESTPPLLAPKVCMYARSVVPELELQFDGVLLPLMVTQVGASG